jgi:hypothetical protein
MKNLLIALLLIAVGCFACGPVENKTDVDDTTKIVLSNKDIKVKSSDGISPATKDKMLGPWTSEGYNNAVFDIRKDSIYYIEDFASYKYDLTQDSIKIDYPDGAYSAKIYFIKDTLVMRSEDGEAKYWKFTD